jgi:YHS domain-containing protein
LKKETDAPMPGLDQRTGMETGPGGGMAVNPADARAKGLASEYEGKEYFFCGRGCFRDFSEGPERFLDPSYVPHM